MENVNDKVGKAAKGHQDPILMSVNVIGIANHFICKVNFLMILRALPFVVYLYNLQKGLMLILYVMCDIMMYTYIHTYGNCGGIVEARDVNLVPCPDG